MLVTSNTSVKYGLLFSIVIVSVIVSSTTSLVYGELSYLEQVQANYDSYNNSLWSLGDNIQEGDYFVYKICNDDIVYQVIYPYHCYEISLEFVKILESYTGDTWIVQSYLTIGDTIDDTIGDTIGNNTRPLILLIDPYTFHVTTDPFNKKIGDSIQNTIFSLSTYGEQSLSIGTIWDYLDSYFTNDIPLEIKNKQSIQILNGSNYNGNYSTIETSVLSYDIIIPSNTYLHNDFPFPLKAKLYSPNIIYPEPQELYYYELIDYSNYYSRDYRFNDTIETMDGTILDSSVELGGLKEK